jgi:N-acetylglucosamine-6-phosphate deacetylase
MQLFGRRYDTAEPVSIEVAEGRISQVTPWQSGATPPDRWPWISPGLFDIQTNGYGGQEFSSPKLSARKVAEIAEAYLKFGVTRFCPTLTTESFAVLKCSLKAVDEACRSMPDAARRIAGIHLEGPYVTPQDGARGAHPQLHCRPPDWDEFQKLQQAAGGRIRVHTMSPEFDQAPDFIRKLADSGVVVAIGHTSADSDQIRRAVDAGARLSTHLGNGTHLFLPRHPNYVWDQLADDRLMASLIADGQHLPAEVVKTFVRAKTARRCILVSDMSGMAGLAPGRYETGLCSLEILPDGRLVVAGQRDILAGASRSLAAGVANVMRFAGVDLPTAIEMATAHPAELLDVPPDRLETGLPANLVQFDLDLTSKATGSAGLEIRATVADGQLVYGQPWVP